MIESSPGIGEEGHSSFTRTEAVTMSVRSSLSRRGFLATAAASTITAAFAPKPALARVAPPATKTPQRVCVVLFDGFGPEYYDISPMPTLKAWAKDGFFKQLKAAMPTVT